HVGLAQAWDAHGKRRRLAEPREHVRVHGYGRNAVLLERHREPDDRRAAGASKTDAEDGRGAIGGNGGAHLLIVGPGLLRPDRTDLHCGQAIREPARQLLHEHVGVVEPAVDEIDRLSVERRRPWSQAFADDLWWITTGIMNSQLLIHGGPQTLGARCCVLDTGCSVHKALGP